MALVRISWPSPGTAWQVALARLEISGEAMPSHEGASPPASSVTGRCHFQAFTHVGTKEIARQHVLQFSKPLAAVLAEGSFQGVLVVYVASSSVWKKTVDLVSSSGEGLRASDLTAQALADRAASLMRLNAELVETKQHCNETMRMLEAAAPSLSDLNRVRIVTPLDFIDVLDYINSRLPDNFKYWFQQTTYDVCPATHNLVPPIRAVLLVGCMIMHDASRGLCLMFCLPRFRHQKLSTTY